jgi:hypothetical protein
MPSPISPGSTGSPPTSSTVRDYRLHLMSRGLKASSINPIVGAFRFFYGTPSHVLDEPMMVAVPKGRELTRNNRKRAVTMKELARETFILFGPPGTGMYDRAIAACRAAGFNPRVGQQALASPPALVWLRGLG